MLVTTSRSVFTFLQFAGQVNEKLRRAIDIVVGYSRVSDETKERLKSAVTDVHCKTMSEQAIFFLLLLSNCLAVIITVLQGFILLGFCAYKI